MDLVLAENLISRRKSKSDLRLQSGQRGAKGSKNSHGVSGFYNKAQPGKEEKEVVYREEATNSRDTLKLKSLTNLIRMTNEKLDLYINNEYVMNKDQPVPVSIYVVFLRVGEVDNVKEQFHAEIYLEAKWRDDEVDWTAPFDPNIYWEPEIYIENMIKYTKQDVTYRVERIDDQVFVHECRQIRGTFWERLELWSFPFDVQNLSVVVTTLRDTSQISLVQDEQVGSSILTENFQQQQEWRIYDFVETTMSIIDDRYRNQKRPCLNLSGFISRRPGYYIYNAYMLIFLITVLGFCSFSYAYTLMNYRIQTTCVLILSSINFRWAVTQKLPAVPYLTALDWYALGGLLFLVAFATWFALIGSGILAPSSPTTVDTGVLIALVCLFVIFHLIYGVFFVYKLIENTRLDKQVNTPQATAAVAPASPPTHLVLNQRNSVYPEIQASSMNLGTRESTGLPLISPHREFSELKPTSTHNINQSEEVTEETKASTSASTTRKQSSAKVDESTS